MWRVRRKKPPKANKLLVSARPSKHSGVRFPTGGKRVMCLGQGGKDNSFAYQLQPPVSLSRGHFTLSGLFRCTTVNSEEATAAPLWGSGLQLEGSRWEKKLQFSNSPEHRKTEKPFNDGKKYESCVGLWWWIRRTSFRVLKFNLWIDNI